jgi:hypothetical protein
LLSQSDLIGKCTASGNNNNAFRRILFFNFIEALNQCVSLGQAAAQFDDNHFFSVSLPSTGSGTLSNSIVFNTDGSFRKVIAGMAAYLWLDSGTVGSHDGSDIQILELGTSAEGTKTANYISDTGSLPTGSYFIEVTGYGAGTKGGSYSFIASAVPVPEPETWAMLVAGLGLVGLQLRRRTNTGKISIN